MSFLRRAYPERSRTGSESKHVGYDISHQLNFVLSSRTEAVGEAIDSSTPSRRCRDSGRNDRKRRQNSIYKGVQLVAHAVTWPHDRPIVSRASRPRLPSRKACPDIHRDCTRGFTVIPAKAARRVGTAHRYSLSPVANNYSVFTH